MIKDLKLCKKTQGFDVNLCMNGMGRAVILTGENGVGKTRLLTLLTQRLTGKIEEDVLSITKSHSEFNLYDLTRSSVEFNDPQKFPIYLVQNAEAQLTGEKDLGSIYNNGLLFLKYLLMSDDNNDKSKLRKFNELLVSFLGTEVEYKKDENGNEYLNIFNRKFLEKELSPGQKYILAVCIAIFSYEEQSAIAPDDDTCNIFILDEPELHLHSKVLIDFIERLNLSTKNRNSQLWIATHSVALISYVDPDYVWCMSDEKGNDGKTKKIIKKMRSDSGKALKSLLGEYLKQISNFLSTGGFAINQFAAEALLPEPPSDDPKSPQLAAIMETIRNKIKSDETINILDWGAGKCRLYEALEKQRDELGGCFNFNYTAYDPEPVPDARYVKHKIGTIYKSLSDINGNSYDAVFLINTLHEIELGEWSETFSKIADFLLDRGVLVISEVEDFTVGELPHMEGYFVLSDNELKILLGDQDGKIVSYKPKESINNIVAVHIIPKELLLHPIKLEEAIKALKDRAFVEVKEIRKIEIEEIEKEGYKLALKYAFWSHQLVNILVWQEENNV